MKNDPKNPAKTTAHTIRQDLLKLLDDYSRNENSSRSKIMERALKEYFKRERLLQQDGTTPKHNWKRSRV
jgi:metal-responsive CopG/Arc/MetJ family transcriptional regulator